MIRHLRSNAVAYLALFVALGGSAYAASKVTSSDIKDNTIKGKDIRTNQVTGGDLRDESATGADIANGSLDGSDVKDQGLTGGDIADKSIGGAKVDPLTKVPNADMLDGHGSTRYGVGLQMGVAILPDNGPTDLFPVGVTNSELPAISPEVLEIRDFTATGNAFDGDDSVGIALVVDGVATQICPPISGSQVCHLASNVQFPVAGQAKWALRFTGTGLEPDDSVTYSYRAVR